MDEQSIVDILNEKRTKLVLNTDDFCSYDAEDDNYIVEIKIRRKYYPTKIIESMKLFSNYQKAQLKEKKFLYVVADSRGIYVFNISKHIKSIVKYESIGRKLSATTDFGNSKKIIKYTYELPEQLADKLT